MTADRSKRRRGVLWLLFLAPGEMFANYQYLFPRRGKLWATGRRKKSRAVHFMYTIVIYAWALIAFVILGAILTAP
jgi:hypothetical protein